jgi:hypothetical protein
MVRIAALLLVAALLAPFAATTAISQDSAPLDGVYDVQGVNPDGTTYSGEVSIRQQASKYYFSWRIGGGDAFEGNGTRRGNRLTVDWGQPDPVIYSVGNDGVLRGTWSKGQATEVLLPRTTKGRSEGSNDLDGVYDVKGANPNGSTYSGEVSIQYQSNTYQFRWRMEDGQTFDGRGTLRGKALTVHWGQQHPVIYIVGNDGVLRGTWDNGQATEELFPRSARPPEGSTDLDGLYDVRGTNPNGTKYTGEVSIRFEGSEYDFRWRIASGQVFEGKGNLRRNSLSVDWGQQYPVIYAVGKDGVLRGTWSNGRGTEDLFPRIGSTRPPPPDNAGEATTAPAPPSRDGTAGVPGTRNPVSTATGKILD